MPDQEAIDALAELLAAYGGESVSFRANDGVHEFYLESARNVMDSLRSRGFDIVRKE